MPCYWYSFIKEWGSWICGTSMVLFWMFCFVLGYMLLKNLCPYFRKKSGKDANIDNPVAILKTYYAKGEIDRVEFLEKKKDLEE